MSTEPWALASLDTAQLTRALNQQKEALAQAAVDQVIAAANETMDTATTLCSAACPAASDELTSGDQATSACLDALEQVQQAQESTATAQQQLADCPGAETPGLPLVAPGVRLELTTR